MLTWGRIVVIALGLAIAGTVYIRLRWHGSPQTYRAMMGLAACYFLAGALAGVWVLHLAAPRSAEIASTSPAVPISPVLRPGAPATASAAYLPNHYTAKVVSITGGDTIDVALAPGGSIQAIRLYGIDAPEHDLSLRRAID